MAGPPDQPSRIVTTYRAKSYFIVSNGSGWIMSANWTSVTCPSQEGRVAVITGANTGLGFDTAKVLAERGATVVLAVRDVEKGKRRPPAHRGAARTPTSPCRSWTWRRWSRSGAPPPNWGPAPAEIDLLINNAGVMFPPRQATRDGFELQFGTNHLGHFALTGLLLELMLPVPGSRVVTVSSLAHRIRARINFDDLQGGTVLQPRGRVRAVQAREPDVPLRTAAPAVRPGHGTTIAVAAHPGVASTELMRNTPAIVALFHVRVMSQSRRGALPVLRAATDPAGLGGQYYGPAGPGGYRGRPQVVSSSPQSYDMAIQRRLWAVSEELTAVKFPVG